MTLQLTVAKIKNMVLGKNILGAVHVMFLANKNYSVYKRMHVFLISRVPVCGTDLSAIMHHNYI